MAHASALHGPVVTRPVDRASDGWLTNPIRKIARYFRLRAAERELNALDDHLLADIGISRGDIHFRVWDISDDG